ncbi:hypothetical protein SAMN05216232_2000 [Virgibacillus subterraneus]|uniref:DUF3906 family protein n=1 Tax=Virgibacillus subterraneus TaxID=621109 RepID=A0A1H9EEB4_9BACI|nr:hypothetical protein [Virgibacillus subterraneus]SEQ24011.1 hypothetical protein SAMN05216232_2000 [Virgibacillus subterraneus]
MNEKIKVLVVTLKGDVKYQIGMDKKVSDVLKEIQNCKDEFYPIIDNCAVRKSEIISVESVEYDPNKEGNQ